MTEFVLKDSARPGEGIHFKSGNTARRNLDRTIHLGIIAASIIPIIIVFGVMSYHLETSFKKVIYGQIEDMVYRDTRKIDSFLSERLAVLKLFIDNNAEKMTEKSFLRHQLEALRNVYGNIYLDLGIVDMRGNYKSFASLRGDRIEKPLGGEDWFINAISKDAYISDIFRDPKGNPYFIAAVKLETDEETFVLKSSIDFSGLEGLVEDLGTGKSGTVCIINRKGDFQFNPSGSGITDGKTLAVFAEKYTGYSSLRSKPATFENNGKIYSISYLKDGDWLLVFRQDKDELLESVISARRTLLLVLSLVSAFVVTAGLIVSNRIIMQIDRLETEKEELSDKIIEAGKLSSLGQMAAGIAHEINNPVAVMVEEAGWIQDILEDIPEKDSNTEEIARSVAQIRSQGTRCRNITHKLLTFARKPDHKIEPVDVNTLIREMLDLVASKAHASGVRISFQPDPAIPPVAASSTDLHQVFMNLVNNALDAMDEKGGQLGIEISKSGRDMAKVRISDTGEGISADNLQKIYDPFFTTKPAGKGTGLGLSICYGIIRDLRGEIKANSVPGAGSIFEVILPLYKM